MSKNSPTFGVGQQAGSGGTTESNDRLCEKFGFIDLCFVSFSGHGTPMFADPPPDARPSCRPPAYEHTFASGGNRTPCKPEESMNKPPRSAADIVTEKEPESAPEPAPTTDSGSTFGIGGYVVAVLLPPIGILLSLILLAKSDRDWMSVMVVSLIFGFVWASAVPLLA